MRWLPWVSLVDFSLGFLPFVCFWLFLSLFLDSGTILGSTGQMFYKRPPCLNFTVSSQSDGGLQCWPPGHRINFYYDNCIMLKEHATHKTIAARVTPNYSLREYALASILFDYSQYLICLSLRKRNPALLLPQWNTCPKFKFHLLKKFVFFPPYSYECVY